MNSLYEKYKEKTLKYKKLYYQKNKEKIKNKQKNNYQKNKKVILEKNKDYYKKNCLKILDKKKLYYTKNKQKKSEYDKNYYQKNKEKKQQYNKNYRLKNRETLIKKEKEYRKLRYRNDYIYKIKENCRRRILTVLKNKKVIKSKKTEELIGCSVEELKNYLEKMFKPGMGWENHGRFGWHIDHIKPCSSFDLTKLEEQKACFHYTNLQPLWWDENLNKGGKL